jgi:hypothetical protein
MSLFTLRQQYPLHSQDHVYTPNYTSSKLTDFEIQTIALCSPVRLGIHFVGRVPSWSVMHAVCSLEYAYVLSQFVRCVTRTDLTYALETEEQALLSTIKETLCEVESSMPQESRG